MMALRVYGPTLWAPRTIFLGAWIALWIAIHIGVFSGGVDDRLAYLREMAASVDGRRLALERAMRFTLQIGGWCGVLVATAHHELQRMHASWGFASVRTGLRWGLLGGTAIVALISGPIVALWLPPSAAIQAGLVGVLCFGLATGSLYPPYKQSKMKTAILLPLGALCLTLFGAPLMVAVAGLLGVPGLALLTAACLALGLRTTSAEAHRRLIHAVWPPASDRADAPDATADAVAARPPLGVIAWLLRLEDEAPTSAAIQRFFPLPSMLRLAAGTAALSAWIYATDTGLALIGMIMVQRTMKVAQPLPYPLSRRARANIQFAEQTLVMIVIATVATMVTAGLSGMDVPRFPWFSDGQPPKLPPAVGFAAVFALFPVGQLGRPWAPLGAMPEWQPRQMLLVWLPFVAQAILAVELGRTAWRLSGEDVTTAVTACVVLGVVLQALSYPYVQSVFARRDLVHPRR